MESKKISMDIPIDMYNWLDKHKNINRSEVFRKAVEDLRNKVKKTVQPVLQLLTIWANVGAAVLLICVIIPSPIPRLIRGVLAVFAGIISLSAMTMYMRVRKEIMK